MFLMKGLSALSVVSYTNSGVKIIGICGAYLPEGYNQEYCVLKEITSFV
jgi:hypothetical protein